MAARSAALGPRSFDGLAEKSDIKHRFNKRRIEVSLRTKSEVKATKSASALSDRLERYWDSLRMEMIYSRELGLNIFNDTHGLKETEEQ